MNILEKDTQLANYQESLCLKDEVIVLCSSKQNKNTQKLNCTIIEPDRAIFA